MPNWCNNHLKITVPSPELRVFLENHGLDFEAIAPLPCKEHDNDVAVQFWGTKWKLDEWEAEQVAKELLEGMPYSASFRTAWSPPIEAIVALSDQFHDDIFFLTYYELGFYFAGALTIHRGKIHGEEYNDDENVMRIAELLGYQEGEND